VRLHKWLPAGPVAGGAERPKALVQFYADKGGLQTVAAEDLVVL